MRLLLVNPRLPESFWSFRWALDEILTGRRSLNPPLGLATIAALTPPGWQVRIVDENVEPLPLAPAADVVAIGGMGVQAPRQRELLAHYRRRGYYTVVGGAAASLQPEAYAGLADTVIAGEAEYLWPRFCADFAALRAQPLYRETGAVDLADSPVPRFDLLRMERYATATVQLSRGCPYRCEFCDIIVMFGRRPRYKRPEQIGRELDALRALGARKVFFVDDNFIGDRRRAIETLRYLADYQDRHGRRLRFGTEASLNLARDTELLALFRAAGFEWVFVGLETPDVAALREVGKTQNCAGDMAEAVRRLHASGLDVLGGFIVGFDADDAGTFERQRRFILDTGIVVAMVGLLSALPKTPLYERLRREGRLDEGVPWADNTRLATNVVPKTMAREELIAKYRTLHLALATDRAIAARIRAKLRHYGRPPRLVRETFGEAVAILARLLARGILPGGPARLWHFLASLPWRRPWALAQAVTDWIAGLALQDYVRRHFALAPSSPRAEYLQLRRRLRRLLRRRRVRLERPAAAQGAGLAVHVRAPVDARLARVLGRALRRFLARSASEIVVSLSATTGAPSGPLESLSRALGRYAARATFVYGAAR